MARYLSSLTTRGAMGILTFECGEMVSLSVAANTLELTVELGVVTLPPLGPATPTA